MIKTLTILSLLISFIAAEEVRHVEVGDELLVDTSPTFFALKAQSLIERNFLTVSINGGEITIAPEDCSIIRDNIGQLNHETSELIDEIRTRLVAAAKNPDANVLSSISSYELGGPKAQYSSTTSSTKDFEYRGFAFSKVNDSHFTVRRLSSGAGLNRIFVDDDTVTFVAMDGKVMMKPWKCLSERERRFVNQLNSMMRRGEKATASS